MVLLWAAQSHQTGAAGEGPEELTDPNWALRTARDVQPHFPKSTAQTNFPLLPSATLSLPSTLSLAGLYKPTRHHLGFGILIPLHPGLFWCRDQCSALPQPQGELQSSSSAHTDTAWLVPLCARALLSPAQFYTKS